MAKSGITIEDGRVRISGRPLLETSTVRPTRTMPGSRKVSTTELLGYITVLTKAALAPSTQSTYKRAWSTFEVFSSEVLCQVMPLPLSVSTLSLFVAYLFKKGFASSTISTYLSAIAYVHKMLSMPDNTRSFLIDKLVTGTCRLSATVDTRLPITIPVLNKILAILPSVIISSYELSMFKAMYLFAFSAFARIGELVSVQNVPVGNILQLQDVSFSYAKSEIKEVNVCFRRYKHSIKQGPRNIKFSHGEAMVSAIDCLVQYLTIRPKTPGPLFCSLTGQPISRSHFDKVLHKCLKCCQLDSSKYKGHSFRIGAATAAAERGLSDSQIRAMGRWNSNAFRKYIRSSA